MRKLRPTALRAVRTLSLCAALTTTLAIPTFSAAQGLQPGGPVDFGSLPVGTTSLNLTQTFTATATTTIASVITTEEGATGKDFAIVANTCTGTIFKSQSCNVTITFTPAFPGLRRGALTITSTTGSIVRLYLHGIGLGPQIVFSPVSATALTSLSTVSPSTFKTSAAVYDGAGNLFFNDYLNGRVLEQSTSGSVSVIATLTQTDHSAMAIDGAGTLYVSAPSLGIVQVIVPGVSSTVLPTPGVTLVSPAGLAVDSTGQIYIADSQANQIVRVSSDAQTASVLPLTGLGSSISSPYGLAVDNTNLYIADYGSGRIVAANLNSGNAFAFTPNGALANPFGIAVDSAGTVLVANAGNVDLVQVSPSGAFLPLASAYGYSIASQPLGIAEKATGNLVASDGTLGLVTITRTTGQLTFPTPTKATFFDSTDGYLPISVQNSGNQPLQFNATDPAITPSIFTDGTTNTCPVDTASGTPLLVATNCTYTVGFTPTSVGNDTGTLTVQATDTVTNAAITAVTNLAGTAVTQVDTLVVTATPNFTQPGVPVSFTVSAQQGSTVITTFTGTVTFTMTDSTGAFLSGASYTFTTADAGVHTFAAPVGAQFNTPGVYTISAHLGSVVGVSNTVTVQYTSTTTLTSTVNPVFINNLTTLTAIVSAPGATVPATGTITFYDGTTSIGTCTLVAGQCTLPVSFTVAGNHSLTAVYPGDTNYTASTSAVLIQVVNDFTAQVTMTSSINPSFVNQQTTLTATVVAAPGQPGAGSPTGTITFSEGGITIGTCTLVAGQCTATASFNPARIHPLIATYSGNLTFGSAVSATYSQVVIEYTTQATLTSSINPSLVNQQTVLTATISATSGQAGSGTPTGTVTFKDGSTTIGTGTLVNGVATLTIGFATIGNHPLTVVYAGDGDVYSGVTSSILIQVVNDFNALATLTSSINPSFVGQSTTLTATISAVAGQPGSVTPTGTVTFKDGTTTIGTCTLVSGVCTASVSFATPGNHPLTAVYAGDANYATATSAILIQVVNLYAAQVSLASSVNPSVINQSTTLTASVSATAGQTGSGTPSGTITFKDGATTIATCTLVNGSCTASVSFTTNGSHPLTAVYSGDTNFGTSTSPVLTQVVGIYASQASLTSSVNPSFINQQTILTATIAPTAGETGAPTPTGTVVFKNGASNLGTVTLVNGVATLPVSFAAAGSYMLTVVYPGDSNFNPSTSAVLVQVVNSDGAVVTVTSSINPSFVNQQTIFTVTVAPSPGLTGTPTGTVTFSESGTNIGTCTLVAGTCTSPGTFNTARTHPILATYSGDTNFLTAKSPIFSQVVVEYATQAAITSSVNPSNVGQQTTLTITVSAVAGQAGSGTPTGAVTVKDGTTTIGSGTLTNGVYTLNVSFSTPGNHLLTVVYAGDGDIYNGVTSPSYTQVVNGQGAQAALTSSINPSFVNQATTLTATVSATAGATGTPTGTVTFKNGATTLSTVTLVNGVATYAATFTTAGSYPITAVYSGDTNFSPVTSAILTQVVNDYTATSSLTSSINPSALNQATTLTATFAPTAGQIGAVTPTGTVLFKDGATTIGTCTLATGTCNISASFTTLGNHLLTAVYSGDANYPPATTAVLTQVVQNFSATVALTSSINPSFVNQQTTFTATVSPTIAGSGTPTGTVTFKNGTTTLGTANLTNGVATYPATFPTAGSYPITAVYSGDTNFTAATSSILTQVVNNYTAQAALTSSVNPSLINQQTTFTATISATAGQSGSSTPTGTVTFKNGTTVLGTATLVNGVATYAASFATAGSYPITVVYSGDTNFAPITSGILVQVVNNYTAQAALTSSVNPSFVNQQTVFTATLTPTAGQSGSTTPTGTVTFKNGATTLGTAALVNGVATYNATFAIAGSYPITFTYSGDANYSPLTSAILTQVVNNYAAQASLTSSVNPSFVNQQTIFTATVAAVAGQSGSGTPTGTVTFMNGTTTLGTSPLVSGVATYAASFATAGSYPITAVYSGDANFGPVTTAILTQVVNDYASTATLTSSINPTFVNQQTTLTATVAAATGQSGAGTPTGSVTFLDGATKLGTVNLSSGSATLPVTFAVAGSHALTCTYSGDTSFTGASCGILTQVVNVYITQVALTASVNPVFINASTTLTATVTPAAGQGATTTPTGTVTFLNGLLPLGTVVLNNGQATLPVNFPFVASLNITAVYSGDFAFAGATSPSYTLAVEDFSIAVATGTSNTATVLGGNTTNFTFALTPLGGPGFAGPITFTLTGQPAGTVYTFTPMSLAAGASATNVILTLKPPPLPVAQLDPSHHRPGAATRVAPIVLAFLILPFALRRRRPAALFLWMLLCVSAIGVTGCATDASTGYYGNTPQTSTLTITATSGNLSHTTTVTLIVQ